MAAFMSRENSSLILVHCGLAAFKYRFKGNLQADGSREYLKLRDEFVRTWLNKTENELGFCKSVFFRPCKQKQDFVLLFYRS